MAKRTNNEGTIYRLKNGKWRAQYFTNGKRVSHTSKTKTECQLWINSHKEMSSDYLTEGSNPTLGEYLEFWLQQIQLVIRPTTFYQYNLYSDRYILTKLGSLKIRSLSLGIVQEFYNSLFLSGLGYRTVKIIHNVIHHALDDAVNSGVIPRNPAHGAKFPKHVQKEMKFLNEDQVSQLLLAAQGDRYEALYHLAIATGMRQSELLGLKWIDLDLIRGIVRVERQLKRYYTGNDYFSTTKTQNGKRVIKVGESTIFKLQQHHLRQDSEKVDADNKWQEHDLVFPSSIGTPLNQMNLYTRFIRLLEKAGLPKIRFHDLRHTAATLLLNHKIPMIVVSRRLGHHKVSFTMDTYGHTIPELQDEAANLIDDLITPYQVHLHTDAHEEIKTNLIEAD